MPTLQSRPIELLSRKLCPLVPRENVYFAFSSGRLTYDCITCNSKCCRGHGYHLQGAETQHQLNGRRALTFFLDKPKGPSHPFMVQNLAPSCFFLSPSGLCEVQVEQGHAAKPETCRLFPFNEIRKIGSYLVVSPHLSLCPLGVAAIGSVSDRSDHEHLFEAMASQGLRTPVPEVDFPTQDLPFVLERERTIRDAAEGLQGASSYRECVIGQLLAAPRGIANTAVNEAANKLEEFEAQLVAVMGICPSRRALGNPSLVATMLAITPILRAEMIFRIKAPGTESLPAIPEERIPHFLMALNTMAALAVDAGMKEVTYQTLTMLFKQCRQLLTILAFSDCRMRWHKSAMVGWPLRHDKEFEAGYLDVVKGLFTARTTLGQLLASNAPAEDAKRVMFLKHVSKALAGRIVLHDADDPSRGTKRFRRSLQRWTLRHVSPTVLQMVSDRHRQTQDS